MGTNFYFNRVYPNKEEHHSADDHIGKRDLLSWNFTFYAPNLWQFANMPLDTVIYYYDDSKCEECQCTIEELRTRFKACGYKIQVMCEEFF